MVVTTVVPSMLTVARDPPNALATTLAAKTAHDLLEVVVETLGLALQCRGLRDALWGKVGNELEDFF